MSKYLDIKGLNYLIDILYNNGINDKYLSHNDFTDNYKSKLDNIPNIDTLSRLLNSIILGNSDNFEEALNNAIQEAEENTIIDMTRFTGEHICEHQFIINKPVTIKLGNIKLIMNDINVFNIQSNNVHIIGVGRSTDSTVINSDNNCTTLILNGQSPLPNEGYHIYSRGYKNCSYSNMNLVGIQSHLSRQFGNTDFPIDGTGGIFIEKYNPGHTAPGNTCNNTIIDNLLIHKTKTHAIYIDTPILTTITNVRCSDVAGHGIFINNGTSISFNNVYIASCGMSGFCLNGVSYASLLNCVSEKCGSGFWFRGSFNVSVFNPGVEVTIDRGNNPWNKTGMARPGFNQTTTDSDGNEVRIIDVPNDSFSLGGKSYNMSNIFHGYGYVITGGRNIDIYSPYIIDMDNESSGDTLNNKLRYFLVTGNNRMSKILGAGIKDPNNVYKRLQYEFEIGSDVSNFELTYNPEETSMKDGYTSSTPVTDNTSLTAPILNLSTSTYIRCGNTIYSKLNMDQ